MLSYLFELLKSIIFKKDICYENLKLKYIQIFIDNQFAIFPTNLDKTPMIKWSNLTLDKSKKLYNNNTASNINNYTSNSTFQRSYNNFNIGILCGKISGIVVIDIDIKDNGLTFWNNIISKHIKIDTLICTSGSGGKHYYFKYDDRMSKWKSKNRIFYDDGKKIGIDLRSDNGYIIAPPSIHYSTQNLYKFINFNEKINIRHQIKEMPNWLYEKIDPIFDDNFDRFKYKELLTKEKLYETLSINTKINKHNVENLFDNLVKIAEYGLNHFGIFRIPNFITLKTRTRAATRQRIRKCFGKTICIAAKSAKTHIKAIVSKRFMDLLDSFKRSNKYNFEIVD